MMATVSAQTGAETTTGPIFESMADLSVEQLRARVSGDMPFLSAFQCLVGSVLALVQGQTHQVPKCTKGHKVRR